MSESFAHLHVHTEFSMLDGASRVDEVVAAAATDEQPALGITDHAYTEVTAVIAGELRPGDDVVTTALTAKAGAPGGQVNRR